MEPVLFVMAIMGCGDGSTACAEARVHPASYTSIQSCLADMPNALSRHTDLQFPELGAACRRNAPQMADSRTARAGG